MPGCSGRSSMAAVNGVIGERGSHNDLVARIHSRVGVVPLLKAGWLLSTAI